MHPPRSTAWLIVVVALAHGVAVSEAGTRGTTGAAAPPFDLPLLGSDGYLRSQQLFRSHDYTLLVFWHSGCPHCIESLTDCEDFLHTHAAESLTAVGIHADSDDSFAAEQAVATAGVTFAQVWDRGGFTWALYGVELATFSLFLVDGNGTVVERAVDPAGDVFELLEAMWQRAHATEVPPAVSTIDRALEGFAFAGDARLRFLGIDSQGSAATGPYGEAVGPGNQMLFRFELEMTRRIGRRFRAGGLLRISNEDAAVLEAGPKYLGADWGSAFAEVFAGNSSLRLGYYGVVMTPLTLMRWDWDDNPRIGGNTGCGCGAAAGVLLVESLEELSPELVFEGAIADFALGGVRTRAFYAIPRRALDTSYLEARSTGAERARYSLELGGVESLWRRRDRRTSSQWRLGLRAVASWENRRSVDFDLLGYPVPEPWTSSGIVTVDWSAPLVRSLDLAGEWIVYNEATTKGLGPFGGDDRLTLRGEGGIAGIIFARPSGWRVRADYLRLDSEVYAPFAALSYTPNRQGARVSLQVPLVRQNVLGSAFYKRLEEVSTSAPGGEKAEEAQFGTSLDVSWPNGWGGSAGWLDDGRWRGGALDAFDGKRTALVVTVRHAMNGRSLLELQYQRIDSESWRHGESDDAQANLYSVYLKADL